MPGKESGAGIRNRRRGVEPERSIYMKPKTWSRRETGAPPSSQWKWNDGNRHKLRAHAAVRKALQNGSLKRGRCAVCQSFRCEAHHEDYSKPLEVIWLCRLHHRQRHAELRVAGQGDD
jgi:hypothetical protein